MTQNNGGPATNGTAITTPSDTDRSALHRRRAAASRCEPLECGCVDPWTCRHHDGNHDTDRQTEAAIAAGDHLLGHRLGPIYNVDQGRALWRAGRRDLAVRCVQQVIA